MRKNTITKLAATAIITAAGLAAFAAPADASFGVTDEGYGATLQLAENDALMSLHGDYYGCRAPYIFYAYGQYSDGSWFADVSANCEGLN